MPKKGVKLDFGWGGKSKFLSGSPVQSRPLPGIPGTPTGVVYEEMELVSISASDQEDNYDHLVLPAAPTTPTSDVEYN